MARLALVGLARAVQDAKPATDDDEESELECWLSDNDLDRPWEDLCPCVRPLQEAECRIRLRGLVQPLLRAMRQRGAAWIVRTQHSGDRPRMWCRQWEAPLEVSLSAWTRSHSPPLDAPPEAEEPPAPRPQPPLPEPARAAAARGAEGPGPVTLLHVRGAGLAPRRLRGLDGAQVLLLCQHFGKLLQGVRRVSSDSMQLFGLVPLPEEDAPEGEKSLVQFQKNELARVTRLEQRRHRSGAHLALLCTEFGAVHARLQDLQGDALEQYGALRRRLVKQLGAPTIPSYGCPIHLRQVAPVAAGLLLNDDLGADAVALCPALLRRLERFRWKQILVRDEHHRIHCIPAPSVHAPIRQALHAAALRLTTEAMEQHRRVRQTERLPDGTVRSVEEEVHTRALRFTEEHGARHRLAQQIQPQVRALEGGCALQELRVEWVQHMTESARLCSP